MTSPSGSVRRSEVKGGSPQYHGFMSKNLEASAPENGTSNVGELRLTSLAPRFEETRHGGYYKLLLRALKDERHRNIALTGAYGAGKSSILQQLVKKKHRKAIVLSLSTITPDAHDTGEFAADETATTPRTREIQKEIVKQLLYRPKPSSVPQSRFRRPDLPRQISAGIIAVGAALAISALTMLLAFDLIHERVEEWFSPQWRQQLAYGAAFVLLCIMMWAIVKLVRVRPKFTASVQSGIATVTLAKGEESYFDAYLDEIVYYFQASRVSIVIIEDIDRFEDVLVFDTLRALNSILNSSQQVGRRVVFIYAIRDSVFEQIGGGTRAAKGPADGDPSAGVPQAPDHALNGLKRASRTKFFDIIIPVVPFVSADNARDLMSEVMMSDEFTVSPALIRLAARHVADMRLIHNIRNEFEVYRDRLVTHPNHVPGITDDIVFALVLYKNTHLADFENIRHRESRLDYLFMFWRHLVSEELANRTRSVAEIQLTQRRESTAAARAERLGSRLVGYLTMLRSVTSASVELSGPATDDTVMDPATWEAIASGEPQTITFEPGYRSEVSLSFSASDLATVLGVPVDGDGWTPSDRNRRQETLDAETERVAFLRHHSWAALAKRGEFRADINDLANALPKGLTAEAALTFNEAIELLLESDLARELVRHGYITSHFAVYSASYYGTHLGPAAREYIWRCIEPGEPDALFEIDAAQIEQLLREQGADDKGRGDAADIFDDASVFNVNILDYLLEKRPTAATRVARRLANMSDQDREFLELYLVHGSAPDVLIAYLTPHWPAVLTYIANADLADQGMRLRLLNAALLVLPNPKYDTDEQVKALIEDQYRDLSAVTVPESAEAAATVAAVLKASGAQIAALADLNALARAAVIEESLYPITFENLEVIISAEDVGLDTIEPHETAHKYVLKHLDQYLRLVREGQTSVVIDTARFPQVVDAAVKHSPNELLRELVALSPSACTVSALGSVGSAAWPALIDLGRTSATFANVDAYLTEYGMDATLGEMLRRARKITMLKGVSTERRKEVAVEIVNARDEIDSAYIRVGLATSIRPGKLAPDELTPERGKLISYLLKWKLLDDAATTFTPRLVGDWDTLKPAIQASKKFSAFVDSTLVDLATFTRMVRDSGIPNEIITVMLGKLETYLKNASTAQVNGLASALADHRWRLSSPHIGMLIRSGASAEPMMRLLQNAGERVTTDDLKNLLQELGGDYARVALGGSGRPAFDNDTAHTYVFGRLVGDTVRGLKAEKYKRWGGNALVVNLQ